MHSQARHLGPLLSGGDLRANGVPAKEGCGWNWSLPPIGIARSSFYRIAQGLIERGALFAEAVGRKFTRYQPSMVARRGRAVAKVGYD